MTTIADLVEALRAPPAPRDYLVRAWIGGASRNLRGLVVSAYDAKDAIENARRQGGWLESDRVVLVRPAREGDCWACGRGSLSGGVCGCCGRFEFDGRRMREERER